MSVFGRDQGGQGKWGQVAQLDAREYVEEVAYFGLALSLSQDGTLVIGAPFKDKSLEVTDTDVEDVGQAYIYELYADS